MSSIEFVDLGAVTVEHVTEKAALITLHSTGEKTWMPLGQMATPTRSAVEEGTRDFDLFRVSEWIAGAKDL